MPAVDSSKVASLGTAAHSAAEETHNPARSPAVGSLGVHNPGADIPAVAADTREAEGHNRPAARNTPAAVDNRQVRSKASPKSARRTQSQTLRRDRSNKGRETRHGSRSHHRGSRNHHGSHRRPHR